MEGISCGFPAKVLGLNEKAVCVDGFSPKFNLVITKSCSLKQVQKFMGIISEVSYFAF